MSAALTGATIYVPLTLKTPSAGAFGMLASVSLRSPPTTVIVNLKLFRSARALAAPWRPEPLSVGWSVALGWVVSELLVGPDGIGDLEPVPQADRAMAATAMRISRPRPCRGATWNTSTSTQSIRAHLSSSEPGIE